MQNLRASTLIITLVCYETNYYRFLNHGYYIDLDDPHDRFVCYQSLVAVYIIDCQQIYLALIRRDFKSWCFIDVLCTSMVFFQSYCGCNAEVYRIAWNDCLFFQIC